MEKKEDNHFIDYLDTTLSVQENKILKNIENIVKTEFSLLESIEKGDFGVFIEDNHVVGLALNQNDLNNTIEAIITLLKNLPKLSVLKLNECNLHSIPKEIENLKSLQKLILMNNNLDSLPDNIGTLNKLTHLTLSKNKLIELPYSLGDLKNLIYLDLDDNEIKHLPKSIGNLKNLKNFRLRNNSINSLCKNIEDLDSLTDILLDGNPLMDGIKEFRWREFILHNGALIKPKDKKLLLNLEKEIGKKLPLNHVFYHKSYGFYCKDRQVIGLSLARPRYVRELETLPEEVCKLTNLQYLSIAYQDITYLPSSITNLKDLKVFSAFKAKSLQTLPVFLTELKFLEKINIWGNKVSNLPDDIGQLKNLKYLFLGKNYFDQIPESIGELSNLELLNLSYNKLEELPNSLGKLSSLKELYLSNNKLKRIPSNIGNLSSLEILNLYRNSLKRLPKSFAKLVTLQEINIKHNKIRILPKEIADFPDLRKLEIKFNPLEEIPTSLGTLNLDLKIVVEAKRRLKELETSIEIKIPIYNDPNIFYKKNKTWARINKNDFTITGINIINKKISKSIKGFKKLKNLKILTLKKCNLTEFPQEISELSGLDTLNLSQNSLKTIPKAIENLTNLKKLYLNNNNLEILPESISNLEKLECLYVKNNNLKELPENIGNLKKLSKLNLNYNNLKKLPKSFGDLESLWELHIKQWGLKKLPNILSKLPKLSKLETNKYRIIPRVIGKIKNIDPVTFLKENTIYNHFTKSSDYHGTTFYKVLKNALMKKYSYLEELEIFKEVLTKRQKQRLREKQDILYIIDEYRLPSILGALKNIKKYSHYYPKIIPLAEFFPKTISIPIWEWWEEIKDKEKYREQHPVFDDFWEKWTTKTIELIRRGEISVSDSYYLKKYLLSLRKLSTDWKEMGKNDWIEYILENHSKVQLKRNEVIEKKKEGISENEIVDFNGSNIRLKEKEALFRFQRYRGEKLGKIMEGMILDQDFGFGVKDNKVVRLSLSYLHKKSYTEKYVKFLSTFFNRFDSLEELCLKSTYIYKYLNWEKGNTLKYLYLSKKDMQTIPETIIQNKSLTKLVINKTNIKSITKSIENMKTLKTLSLSNNKIHSLPESIVNLEDLENLYLDDNYIESLPENIGNLENLIHLNLNNNKLERLPKSFGNLKNLKTLTMYKNHLMKQFPKILFQLESLETLVLNEKHNHQYNNLKELDPDEIEKFDLFRGVLLAPGEKEKILELEKDLSYQFKFGINIKVNNNKINFLKFSRWNTSIKELPPSLFKFTNLEYLKIKNLEIKKIPKDIGKLKKLKTLDLDENRVLSVLPNEIADLKNLEWLSMKNCYQVRLPEDFGKLENLRYLCLDFCKSTKLPDTFSKLRQLRELNLRNCKNVFKLPKDFGNFPFLKTLDLSNTLIAQLPDSIGNMKSLEELKIFNTNLKKIPESIGNLKNLKILELIRLKITRLPESIGKLESLERLDIGQQKSAISLPKSFGNLKNLKKLIIGWNDYYQIPENFSELDWNNIKLLPDKTFIKENVHDFLEKYKEKNPKYVLEEHNIKELELTGLDEFPKEIGEFKELEFLNIRYSYCKKIPKQIQNLTNLKRLIITLKESNNLELPSCLTKITSLNSITLRNIEFKSFLELLLNLDNIKIIRLINNQITHIPSRINKLKNLKYLYIFDNPLNKVPDIIPNLKQLRGLSLSNCGLKTIPKTIGKLKNLEILNLSNNNLTEIPDIFANLKNLTDLYLSKNNLDKIPKDVENLKKLRKLEIGNNRIEKVPEAIFLNENLRALGLRNCPIETIPMEFIERKSVLSLYLSYGFPKIFPENAQGRSQNVRDYLKKLKNWSPQNVIDKIKQNQVLSKFDKENHHLGKYISLIIQKTNNIDNRIKNNFLSLIEEKFGKQIENSKYKILL